MTIDLADREAIYTAAEKLQNYPNFGPVEILINNAGIVNGKLLLDIEDKAIERTFAVNCLAHFYTIKAFLPEMIKQGHGHLVSISSVAGHVGGLQLTDYCASKFAGIGLDESLRLELVEAQLEGRIHTTIVKPFVVSTGMFEGFNSSLVPILSPEYVAERIVSAVRARTTEVILPHYLVFAFALLQLLPVKSRIAMSEFFGTFDSMANFRGRSQETKDEVNKSFNKNDKKLV